VTALQGSLAATERVAMDGQTREEDTYLRSREAAGTPRGSRAAPPRRREVLLAPFLPGCQDEAVDACVSSLLDGTCAEQGGKTADGGVSNKQA